MVRTAARALQVRLHSVDASTGRRLPSGEFEFRHAEAYLRLPVNAD